MDTILKYYAEFMAFSNSNPIFGSAIFVSVFGAFVLTLKDWVFSLPGKLWRFVSRMIYSHAHYRKDQRYDDLNANRFNAFMDWYSNSWSFKNLVRSYRPSTVWVDGRHQMVMVAGLGMHFFTWNGSFGFFYHTEEKNEQTYFSELSIFYFGKPGALQELLRHAESYYVNKDRKNRLCLYKANGDDWRMRGKIRKRNLSSVIMPDLIIERILTLIDDFKANESWYIERGIPYKLIIVLEGPPGTGKTSLIRALASHYDSPLYASNLHALPYCLGLVESGGMVYVEDFDTDSSSHSRGPQDPKTITSVENTSGKSSVSEFVSSLMQEELTDVLNAMDGMSTPHGLIMFMTTNHIEKIDAALIRDERVDEIIHVGYLTHSDICRYIEKFFPGTVIPPGVTFPDTAGSRLQKYMKRNSESGDAFIKAVLSGTDGVVVDLMKTGT